MLQSTNSMQQCQRLETGWLRHCLDAWLCSSAGSKHISCRHSGCHTVTSIDQALVQITHLPGQVDKLLLREMGCALIPRNEHGRRVFDGGGSNATAAAAQQANGSSRAAGDASGGGGGDPSHASSRGGAALVYLAHCKPELCNALLDANWSPGQLASFAVIGESVFAGGTKAKSVIEMICVLRCWTPTGPQPASVWLLLRHWSAVTLLLLLGGHISAASCLHI